MSAVRKSAAKKKKSAKASGPSTISLVLQAIGAIKSGNKGASRAAIANWILANSGKSAGAHFNAVLRRALKTALANGVLVPGATSQRFKLGAAAKATKKKKAAPKRKKSATKKRKGASKKKKAGSRKKKAPSKKRKTGKAGKRKKTASKKKRTSSKRK